MSEHKTRGRETRALVRAAAEVSVQKITIPTWDQAEITKVDGMSIVALPGRQ